MKERRAPGSRRTFHNMFWRKAERRQRLLLRRLSNASATYTKMCTSKPHTHAGHPERSEGSARSDCSRAARRRTPGATRIESLRVDPSTRAALAQDDKRATTARPWSLGKIPGVLGRAQRSLRVCELFGRWRKVSQDCLFGHPEPASDTRAVSKDLARSSARQTEAIGSRRMTPAGHGRSEFITRIPKSEIMDNARRTARDPSTPAAFAQGD